MASKDTRILPSGISDMSWLRFTKSLVSSNICGTMVSVASDGNEGMFSVLVSLLDMTGRPAY